MNIFYLSTDAKECAQMHCQKHKKMILEHTQILSTAHRELDGKSEKFFCDVKGKIRVRQVLPDSTLNTHLYRSFSAKHPACIWARSSDSNYKWLLEMTRELHAEFEYRDGKEHSCKKVFPYLETLPVNIPVGPFTQPSQSMPDYCKDHDPVKAYRNYYINEKKRFATWRNREIPKWYSDAVPYDEMPLVQKLYDGLITKEEYELMMGEFKQLEEAA